MIGRARVQDLARRWVIDRAIQLADPEDTLDPEWDDHRPLGDNEVEELFAWVKGRMADPVWELLPSDPEAREDFAYRLSEDLDITVWASVSDGGDPDYSDAFALCRAADPSFGRG